MSMPTLQSIVSKYDASEIEEIGRTAQFLVPWFALIPCYRELKSIGIHADVYEPMSGDMNRALFVVEESDDRI